MGVVGKFKDTSDTDLLILPGVDVPDVRPADSVVAVASGHGAGPPTLRVVGLGLGREGVESPCEAGESLVELGASDDRGVRTDGRFAADPLIERRGDLAASMPLADDVTLVFESRRDLAAVLARGETAALLALLMLESRRVRSGLNPAPAVLPALLRRDDAL